MTYLFLVVFVILSWVSTEGRKYRTAFFILYSLVFFLALLVALSLIYWVAFVFIDNSNMGPLYLVAIVPWLALPYFFIVGLVVFFRMLHLGISFIKKALLGKL